MKSIKFLLLITLISFWGSACDNSVDLTTDFKDVPIVYGLLSAQDSVHYIKIQRAFLPADQENALDVALNPDSLYYPALEVYLERLSDGATFTYSRVSGTAEGFIRDAGIFAVEPNYLYQLNLPPGERLQANEFYTLHLIRRDDLPEVTATAFVLEAPRMLTLTEATTLNIRYDDFPFRWRNVEGSSLFDISMNINYFEKNELGVLEAKSIIWKVKKKLRVFDDPAIVEFKATGEDFYRFLGAALKPREIGARQFESFDIIINAAGESLSKFINNRFVNNDITASQVVPTFTNVSEGFGIFSSRSRTVIEGFTLFPSSRDSLANGIHTYDLGFE